MFHNLSSSADSGGTAKKGGEILGNKISTRGCVSLLKEHSQHNTAITDCSIEIERSLQPCNLKYANYFLRIFIKIENKVSAT